MRGDDARISRCVLALNDLHHLEAIEEGKAAELDRLAKEIAHRDDPKLWPFCAMPSKARSSPCGKRKFSDATGPYTFEAGERVRVTLVNDTMMSHPIHLHGHFFRLTHGAGAGARKHTVTVLPGGKVSWDFTAEPGEWAFHCHMLYHMHAGMFQVFSVRPRPQVPS